MFYYPKVGLAYLILIILCGFQPNYKRAFAPHKDHPFVAAGQKVRVYTTAEHTAYRLTLSDSVPFADLAQPLETDICVFVNPRKTFQRMIGIGGALTDASAETFALLAHDKQEELLTAYFDPNRGIGYTLARTQIHSCDFSSASYTYVHDGDISLKTFTIDHDRTYRIPFIKRCIARAGGQLTLFCSPWSPPAWMKTNHDMLHGGKLSLAYYQPWANYYVKFIQAYQAAGIPIWGLTIQNEPMATQSWESCVYTADDERLFLKNNLGPTLKNAGLGDQKILIWDHNKDLIFQQATTILGDPEAAKYVWGIAFHWYEDWSGGSQVFENVQRVHETFPDKNLLFTEGCNGPFNKDSLYSWKLGERYGQTMIQNFNQGSVGWTDWNVLLDEKGGPNHVQNYCFAPIHADTKTGKLIYTNAYYYIGHFSKFIRPGAKRIISAESRSVLKTTAYMNPDGKMVVIVMNPSEKKFSYKVWIEGKAAEMLALPHSISTLVI